ncbi:MAG: sigma-70 family RNA polymerase sigma factor [Ilumatobacteraceae bacterium]|nr:sigma-70 family RNA polymerase sigma factor [Ilumatobacteraceae bacterium]
MRRAYGRPLVSDQRTSDVAFQQYVVPELEVMLRVARSLTRNAADAEDLVQDTLVKAYWAIDRFDGQYPRAWLLTIMRNTHINSARRRRPELLRDPDNAPEQAAEERTDDVVEQQIDGRILEALDELDETFRTIIELVDIDGLSYAEAAEVLDVPVGTVMSRLHRARKRIRDRLVDEGFGGGRS